MSDDWKAYETVLRDLRAQRDKIETAIAAIEALRPVEEPLPRPIAPKIEAVKPAAPAVHKPRRFARKTIVGASLAVLREAGEPVHVSEILRQILEGGATVNSKDKANTVGSVLNRRMREKRDIVRVGRGLWALTSHKLPFDLAEAETDGSAGAVSLN